MKHDELLGLLADSSASGLRDWLEGRRWFADKGRGIADLVVDDVLLSPVGDDLLALAIARVTFNDGTVARYFLSLAYTGETVSEVIARGDSADGVFAEAAETTWFGHWLLERLIREQQVGDKAWAFSAHAGAERDLRSARQRPAALMRAEQSNTSLRFGDVVILKLIRRLQPGPNPDAEMLRALADVGFAHVPPFLGEASWRAANGDDYPLALAQAFVPNEGDGWSWMLRRLAAIAAGEIESGADMAPERQLGRRTGELHVALSRVSAADFVPEPASEATVEREIERIARAGDDVVPLLAQAAGDVGEDFRALVVAVETQLWRVTARAAGLRDEIGLPRIRVHGDFHLGQTLRRPDGDWTIIDFEGEPARPVAERRQKSSPLKDVAGMLRSFAYARHATERAMSAPDASGLDRLARWEAQARQAFLAGYRAALAEAGVSLVPADADSFQRALAAWELDKALYEIAYEARNRPDWIDLPLRALLPDGGQPADATGGAPA